MKLDATSALANASRELLAKGDAEGAERVLSPVFNDLKSDVSVLHLMGLIMKAQNRLDQAERYLRSAVANSLRDGQYYNDLGVVLQARGDYAEARKIYRAAIALMPEITVTRVNLVRCMLAAGDFVEAEREARAFLTMAPSAEAWSLLAAVQRAQDKREEALASSEAALRCAPNDRTARTNHAISLDRAGRFDEAIRAYEKLAQQSVDSPELALNYARALYQRGHKEQAEAALTESVKHWPLATANHGALARMRFLRGAGEKATELIEAEIARQPDDASLYVLAADALHRGELTAKAQRVLRAGLQRLPDHPHILTALGVVLDELDQPDEALSHLRRAEAAMGTRATRRTMLSTLLRAGKAEEALRSARTLQREEPDDQFLIAIEATALRMLGDPAFRKLCDYEQFVRGYDIPAPRGFFTAENFNASLADCLRHMHRYWAHPLDQSLRNGTQTGRSLLTIDEPNLKALLGAIDWAIRDYITALPADGGPLARRKRRDFFRFKTLSSMRLGKGGFRRSSVHDQGWISGVYFVAAPSTFGPNQAGWLKLGEPARPVAGCGPEFFVEPKPGRLVLFPSYVWHGTVPFEIEAERLSASFDVVPS